MELSRSTWITLELTLALERFVGGKTASADNLSRVSLFPPPSLDREKDPLELPDKLRAFHAWCILSIPGAVAQRRSLSNLQRDVVLFEQWVSDSLDLSHEAVRSTVSDVLQVYSLTLRGRILGLMKCYRAMMDPTMPRANMDCSSIVGFVAPYLQTGDLLTLTLTSRKFHDKAVRDVVVVERIRSSVIIFLEVHSSLNKTVSSALTRRLLAEDNFILMLLEPTSAYYEDWQRRACNLPNFSLDYSDWALITVRREVALGSLFPRRWQHLLMPIIQRVTTVPQMRSYHRTS